MKLNRQTRAQRLTDQAQVALNGGAIESARRHVARALRLCPELLEARLAEARIWLRAAEPQRALAALDALEQNHLELRDAPAVAFLRAEASIACGRSLYARVLLESLVNRYADDVRPHRMLAALYLEAGESKLAAGELRHVVRLEPADAASRRTLAQLLASAEPDMAAALLVQSAADRAKPTIALRAARLYRQTGRLRDAEAIVADLLRRCPDDSGLWREAGELSHDNGNDIEAVSRMRRSAALWGQQTNRLLIEMAHVHMHAGRPAAAGRCWWRLARRRQHGAQAWSGVLACALAAGRSRLAARARAELHARATGEQAQRLLARQWQHMAAGVELHRIRRGQHDPRDASTSRLSVMLRDAASTLTAHARRHANRADTHYHLAVCRAALGDSAAAVDAVHRALTLNPRYRAADELRQRVLPIAA